jgi:hypothetical protein
VSKSQAGGGTQQESTGSEQQDHEHVVPQETSDIDRFRKRDMS